MNSLAAVDPECAAMTLRMVRGVRRQQHDLLQLAARAPWANEK